MNKKLLLLIGAGVLSTSCELTGLERKRSSDNRQTNITINEAAGQSLYLDNDGWSWLIDRFGNVVDGPFDIGNNLPPGTPPPEIPNPPPPSIPTPMPTPSEAGMGWLVFLLPAMLGISGCVAVGDNARVQMFERGEVQPALALSVGSRTQASSSAAQDDAESRTESLTEGGGAVEIQKPNP